MQVTEILSEGLKREYKVVLPKTELGERAEKRLATLKEQTTLKGFRPGKVPLPHLKRVYGRAVMGEVIQEAINEANGKIVKDGGFKLALEPRVTLPEESTAVAEAVEGRADLAFTVALEILPKIELADFKTLKVTKPVAEPADAEVDEAVQRIAETNRPFQAKDGAAKSGDRVVIGFTGAIDGVPFEGGSAEDVPLVLGAGSFIPGFEEKLEGAKAGDSRTIEVTFPESYAAKHLAGKPAKFEVQVKSVEQPAEIRIDDDFAKTLGLESLAKLKEQVRGRLVRDYAAQSRRKVKRELLDALDKAHKFDAPPTLVQQEFDAIWQQIESDLKGQNKTFADEDTTEEKARKEYLQIAERRVRLGLVIAEIGERNAIKVSDDELSRAVVERARQFPGQEQQIWNHFRQNPNALAGLRAPIFEEKVVDFLLELAKIADKKVDKKELFAEDETAFGAA
ncbi:MAG TPA: trigger factor [Xanthobacteraceae bacterium]|nr:trigger factor [Xanthobacteraceae bacterium]